MSEPVFGPVPSRRLGRSLGVNNVIGKTCSYNCIYCQAGRTQELTIKRRKFYDPEWLVDKVLYRISELERNGEEIDYVTFVPNGEPSLDINIGREAQAIKEAGLRTAVISNGSLLWMEDVRSDLSVFDLVSVKVDAVTPRLWRMINRPHPDLEIKKIIEGIKQFSNEYRGVLITETMLLGNIDYSLEARRIAETLRTIDPAKAYILTPVRPPAESFVKPPSTHTLLMVYEEIRAVLGDRVIVLQKPEEGEFTALGDLEKEILSIISVHPLRIDQVREIIRKHGGTMDVIHKLVEKGLAEIVVYNGREYIVRRTR
ncbi:MAG: radical SAM protein [Crenarchaeota archaeon]|nr:radical SAM protein [Thermoproteota archaeon]